MELNLVNYIRIDLVSPLEPPIVFKDKNPIYGYRFADGLMWIYDTEDGDILICGIALSSIKAVWFNEAPYMSAGVKDTIERFRGSDYKPISVEGRLNDSMVLQEILKNDE